MRSLRANTFQSTWRRSSPGVYARYSANSWLNPKSGDLWRPATKPSTTVFATRSRCDNPAKSWGSIKRVGVCDNTIASLSGRRIHTSANTARTSACTTAASLRLGFPLQHALQDGIRIQALGFSVEVEQDAVPEDRGRKRTNIFKRDMVPAAQQGAGFGGQYDELRGANASAEIHVLFNEIGCSRIIGTRRADKLHSVARDRFGDRHHTHQLLEAQY